MVYFLRCGPGWLRWDHMWSDQRIESMSQFLCMDVQVVQNNHRIWERENSLESRNKAFDKQNEQGVNRWKQWAEEQDGITKCHASQWSKVYVCVCVCARVKEREKAMTVESTQLTYLRDMWVIMDKIRLALSRLQSSGLQRNPGFSWNKVIQKGWFQEKAEDREELSKEQGSQRAPCS